LVTIRVSNFRSLDDALRELKKKTQDILKESKTRGYFLSKGDKRKAKLLISQRKAKKARRL
jgi:ribosomal protein S21